MSLMGKVLVLMLGAAFSTACASRLRQPAEFTLTSDTKLVEGWFSTRGEWALFPSQRYKRYNPYVSNENTKCVSVVNDTGQPRSSFSQLNGLRVVVRGYVADYETLSSGNSAADMLLSKKYFKDQLVENYCLRQFVFIATEVRQY